MGGLVGQAFGVCTNAFGADGRVVALGYGCGAHSSVRAIEGTGVPVTDIVVDEVRSDELDVVGRSEAAHDPVGSADVLPGVVVDDDLIVVDLDVEEPEAADEGRPRRRRSPCSRSTPRTTRTS